MRIVHVCLVGAMTDGWNYQENTLAKYHARQGHDVSVISSQWVYDTHGNIKIIEQKQYDYEGIHMYRIPLLWGNIDSKLRVYKELKATLERVKPEVIFCHGFHFLNVRVVAKYVHKHNVRLYVDNHCDASNSGTNWLSLNILHKILWRRCAHILEPYTKKFYGVLPARVDFLTEVYKLPKEKCELLLMGADDELVEAASKPSVRKDIRDKYHIAEDDFLVMTSGKIDAFKTQTLLLMEAVQKIDNPKLRLIVFGSVTEELMNRVKALADGVKVQYIGWIDAKDSYQYFAASDLVVFPGRHSVFWEQVAAQGIPMLVKDWEGTHHVDVGGNVDFLREDSVDEIEKKLLNMINHPDKYAQMKRIAMEKGRTEFLYSEIAKRSIQ